MNAPDLGRVLVVPFIHMLLSGIVGRGLAISIQRAFDPKPVAAGLAEAIVIHGFYDSAQLIGGTLHWLLLPIIVTLYYLLTTDLHRLARLHPPARPPQ